MRTSYRISLFFHNPKLCLHASASFYLILITSGNGRSPSEQGLGLRPVKMSEAIKTSPGNSTPKLSSGVDASSVLPFLGYSKNVLTAGGVWCPGRTETKVLTTLNASATGIFCMWYNSGFYWMLNQLTPGMSALRVHDYSGSKESQRTDLKMDTTYKIFVEMYAGYNDGTSPSGGYNVTLQHPPLLIIIT